MHNGKGMQLKIFIDNNNQYHETVARSIVFTIACYCSHGSAIANDISKVPDAPCKAHQSTLSSELLQASEPHDQTQPSTRFLGLETMTTPHFRQLFRSSPLDTNPWQWTMVQRHLMRVRWKMMDRWIWPFARIRVVLVLSRIVREKGTALHDNKKLDAVGWVRKNRFMIFDALCPVCFLCLW